MNNLPLKIYEEGLEIENGYFYLNMPNDVYHASKGDSKSSIDVFHENPYKYFNRKQRKQTRPMELGSAIHAACLEPDLFAQEYMLLPEVKDRRQPEYKQAAKALGEGKVFTNDDCEKISGMQTAVHNNHDANVLLTAPGYFEVSGFFLCPISGLQMRVRFDKLAFIGNEWVGVDLKKTQGADDYKFSKSIWDYRYHVQDCIYKMGFKAITGKDLTVFKFIAVEDVYPHVVEVYELCDLSQKIASDEVKIDMLSLLEYKKGNVKAHNNNQSTIISLPNWVLNQFEEALS